MLFRSFPSHDISHTKEGMDFQVKAAQSALFHYIAQKNNADFVNGKMIFLQGSPELEDKNGIKTGRLSFSHHAGF